MGLAKLRRDGFVSVDAGDEEGTVLTKRLPVNHSGNQVTLVFKPFEIKTICVF
jgi:hypothetical protein